MCRCNGVAFGKATGEGLILQTVGSSRNLLGCVGARSDLEGEPCCCWFPLQLCAASVSRGDRLRGRLDAAGG